MPPILYEVKFIVWYDFTFLFVCGILKHIKLIGRLSSKPWKREREEAGRGGGHVPGEGILKAPQWSSSIRSLGHRSTIWCVQCDPIMLQLLVLQYLCALGLFVLRQGMKLRKLQITHIHIWSESDRPSPGWEWSCSLCSSYVTCFPACPNQIQGTDRFLSFSSCISLFDGAL